MFPPPGQQSALRAPNNGFIQTIARLHASKVAQLGAFTNQLRDQRRASRARPRQPFLGTGQRIACAAAFGAIGLGSSAYSSQGGVRRRRGVRSSRSVGIGFGDSSRRTTDVLLVLNVACYAAQILSKGGLMMWGAKVNSLITAGQYWRLVTPAFLHGSLMHLAVNCYSLNNLGPAVEQQSGNKRFTAVYAVAAVSGTAFSYFFSPNPSVGASGAIFGLGGALAMFYYRHRDMLGSRSDIVLKSLGQSLLINVLLGASSSNIDNWGHMGGLVGGAAAAWLLGPNIVQAQVSDKFGRVRQVVVDRPPISLLKSTKRAK